MSDCIFCKIFAGEIPAKEVARTDDVLVFRDLNPQAPHHLLVIPKRHATDLGDFVAAARAEEVGDLFAAASRAGRAASPSGYRIVVNEGVDAGQTVFHLHLHVLAGRNLDWPPG
ncbi:MAG: HIT domain-containing protein [Candidatus Eremiobacteraeota bacterium]|nr:HIT domain-containing protein [Candidatus Eremiobacteraeota bacterium]